MVSPLVNEKPAAVVMLLFLRCLHHDANGRRTSYRPPFAVGDEAMPRAVRAGQRGSDRERITADDGVVRDICALPPVESSAVVPHDRRCRTVTEGDMHSRLSDLHRTG